MGLIARPTESENADLLQATYSNTYDGVCGIGSGGLQGVSMNAAQFGGGSACGQCVQVPLEDPTAYFCFYAGILEA